MVAIFFLISLVGFATAYVALSKTLVPSALESLFGKENLPSLLRNTEEGKIFLLTMITYLIFLPLSMKTELSSLRFSSAFGVLCTALLVYVIVSQFFTNAELVPSSYANFKSSKKIDLDHFVEAVPFITFLYLFQPNVPKTFLELRPSLETSDILTPLL